MKTIFATALLASFFGVTSVNCYANEDSSLLTTNKIEAYATYFGFQNVSDYLKFSSEMNKLMAGRKTLGSPIFQAPEYKEAIASGKSYDQLQPSQKAAFAALVQQRRSTLAETLGVPESELYELMTKYIAYTRLNASIHNLDKSNIFTQVEASGSIERIQVTGQKLQEWGGYGSIMMSVGIGNAAESAGIGQYAEFVVYFQSRGTEQKFQYNNYSGAWSTSNEKVCMEDSCQTGPVIE